MPMPIPRILSPGMPATSLARILLLIVACIVFATAPAGGEAAANPTVGLAFVGVAACASCHRAETEAWRGSHHDLAMAEATEQTVLGDFGGATFTNAGVTSRFFRRDGRFFVATDGPDGRLSLIHI